MRKYKKFKKADMKRFKDNILKTSGLPTHYLSNLTVDEYLNICQICYKAIYYSDYTKNKTPLQLLLLVSLFDILVECDSFHVFCLLRFMIGISVPWNR